MSRVVVTGMGAVTPVGNTVQEFWDALKSGKNGIAPMILRIPNVRLQRKLKVLIRYAAWIKLL